MRYRNSTQLTTRTDVRHGTLKKQPIFDSDPVMNMECFFDVMMCKSDQTPARPPTDRRSSGDRETPAKYI